jgi:hypothetical protein
MLPSLQLPLLLLTSLLFLAACTSTFKYQEEPSAYEPDKISLAIPYMTLAFPKAPSQDLAIQVALVKHKNQAAAKERWLLLHDVAYRWLWVEWQGESWHLLAVGPYKKGHQLSRQRRVLQRGIDTLSSMPAIALHGLQDSKVLSGEAIAEREQESKSESSIP